MKSHTQSALPEELRKLVRWSVQVLGDVLVEEEGQDFFKEIESLRTYLKRFRKSQNSNYQHLYMRLQKKDSSELFRIAHAFSLMLELINSCENAYRSYKIEGRLHTQDLPKPYHQQNIFWVLTAHPTEARNPLILEIFEKILHSLSDALRGSTELEYGRLKGLLQKAWKISLARSEKPTPMDEAQTLFRVLLRQDIVDTFLKLKRVGYNFSFRTWVGGDKDGHPFVDEKTLLKSLTLSRNFLLDYMRGYIGREMAAETNGDKGKKVFMLLDRLKKPSSNDIRFIESLKKCLRQFHATEAHVLSEIFSIFPNLLIPLELREEASVINACVKEKTHEKRNQYAIYRMLQALKNLNHKQPVTLFARGLVISMVSNAQDLENAWQLVKLVFGKPALRVVPLFENRAALESSAAIVRTFLADKSRNKVIRQYWDNKVELMVGYSDSSKEIGVFKSRLLIEKSVEKIIPLIKSKGFVPILFHGSGGSVTRGGGSFSEQSSWWPHEAFKNYKATVQGEMVQRTFASPAILTQNMMHIIREQNRHLAHAKVHLSETEQSTLKKFSDFCSMRYQFLIQDPDFLRLVSEATIYRYLNRLALGSRPSKRGHLNSVSDLRAIPWVLTWTQSRLLMPAWWGIGSAYKELSGRERVLLAKVFKKDPLCQSFLKQLGFTLAKVEIEIFNQYIHFAKHISESEKSAWIQKISKEYALSLQALKALSGSVDLLWFKGWLEESIRYRSPLIHPLNMIQILAIQRHNGHLLRETTTGIACGMMTTG